MSRELDPCGVDQNKDAVRIDYADCVGRSVDQIPIFSFACPQVGLGPIAFNRNSRQVGSLLDNPEIVGARTSRFATVNAERSQDLSLRREYWIRPGSSQPMT